MVAVSMFSAAVLTLYIYLSVVGYRCATQAGQMAEKALGRQVGSSTLLPSLLTLPFVLWLSGLSAKLQGEKKYIAQTVDLYLNLKGLSGTDKRRIREAVREYKRKHSLF